MLTTNLYCQSFSYEKTQINELCSLLFLPCLLYFYIHACQFLTHRLSHSHFCGLSDPNFFSSPSQSCPSLNPPHKLQETAKHEK